MDGIFLIDKPKNMTSRNVVNKIMRKFNIKKCGHCGTLDPFATGLLVITCGKATKISTFIEDDAKSYIATLFLGEKTDTQDYTGEVIETKEVPLFSEKEILDIFSSFIGPLKQTPPIYSAIKVNGKPLYQYARSNEQVDIKSRMVDIYALKLLSFDKNTIKFYVECSKGTYIRTLGEQISEKLHTCGHLKELRRTTIGSFNVNEAKNFEEVEEKDILSVSQGLTRFLNVVVDDKSEQIDIKNGKLLHKDYDSDIIFLKTPEDNPLAIYQKIDKALYKCVRGLF